MAILNALKEGSEESRQKRAVRRHLNKKHQKPVDESIGHIKKGAFHAWLGKSEDEPITAADIRKGLAAGGHAAKMANFARNEKGWHHEGFEIEEMEQLDEGLKAKMSPQDAHEFLEAHGGAHADFHELPSEHAMAMRDKSYEVGFQHNGKRANGSRARYFHAALKRHAARVVKEETIDELSKNKLIDYVRAATGDAMTRHYAAGQQTGMKIAKNQYNGADADKLARKGHQRFGNILRATTKLRFGQHTKESVTAEQTVHVGSMDHMQHAVHSFHHTGQESPDYHIHPMGTHVEVHGKPDSYNDVLLHNYILVHKKPVQKGNNPMHFRHPTHVFGVYHAGRGTHVVEHKKEVF